ncbi:hypothetical protein EVAR_21307_1 [Eumeta japonica]|uniref:Uncharacterized protein n=1 Tax=Eumeta variegata TaxID=151549 RepID=A0A4C1WL44_EUMVA|nr:hypothetical protein EVAR_21307_1 [Eumeta japonica]
MNNASNKDVPIAGPVISSRTHRNIFARLSRRRAVPRSLVPSCAVSYTGAAILIVSTEGAPLLLSCVCHLRATPRPIPGGLQTRSRYRGIQCPRSPIFSAGTPSDAPGLLRRTQRRAELRSHGHCNRVIHRSRGPEPLHSLRDSDIEGLHFGLGSQRLKFEFRAYTDFEKSERFSRFDPATLSGSRRRPEPRSHRCIAEVRQNRLRDAQTAPSRTTALRKTENPETDADDITETGVKRKLRTGQVWPLHNLRNPPFKEKEPEMEDKRKMPSKPLATKPPREKSRQKLFFQYGKRRQQDRLSRK